MAEILRFAEASTMPWLNGGGTTHEIARTPGVDDSNAFDWRLSVADVTSDGAFSNLPGMDRILVLCEGPRMKLRFAEDSHDLIRWEPFSFAGEDPVRCEVPEGPTRDFNIMTRRDACQATARLITLPGEPQTIRSGPGEAFFVSLNGAIAASLSGGVEPVPLGRFDAVRTSGDDAATFTGEGRLLAINILGA